MTKDVLIGNDFMIKGDLLLLLEDIGEGYDGDYDEDNPEDEPLLRFSFYARGDLAKYYDLNAPFKIEMGDPSFEEYGSDWFALRDSSYCTLLSANMSLELKQHAMKMIMNRLYDYFMSGVYWRECAWASWTDTQDVKASFEKEAHND